ncbi:MAG: anthranilate phosphoribosyltransferase [Propionibacteriaceae bacterium]|nr:anthranilate phosphoribosyltransferase [Propionibacteriaceae bacterium]
MSYSWPDILTGLINGQDLAPEQAAWAMDQILAGEATNVQIAGFAVALRAKGETVDEISGLAQGMLGRATAISINPEAVDIVGSGGDRANTVNISTMAAIIAAAAGVPVVKHGNRAASSACGTADCLEALGVALNVPPAKQQEVLAELGIAFLFAAMYHPSLRFAATARRELAVQTTFNFLGPLANPAKPIAQAVGVANERMAPLMAGVLAGRGARGLVFHGGDGLDELTTTTDSALWLINAGQVVQTALDPAELGIARAEKSALVGGSPQLNAAIVRETLGGKPGPVRDIVLLNAAAAGLAYAGPDLSAPVAPQLGGQLERMRAAVDSGAAARLLEAWVSKTQSLV